MALAKVLLYSRRQGVVSSGSQQFKDSANEDYFHTKNLNETHQNWMTFGLFKNGKSSGFT
jgi:hypothetical protein